MSDDVTQDAVLRFAKRLGQITANCETAAVWIGSGEPASWQYVRRDGETIVVSRATVRYWAVRDAAASNGYRLDVPPDDIDAVPGAQEIRGMPHADVLPTLAVAPSLAANSGAIFRTAWEDGSDYPTLGMFLRFGSKADDLGRAGVIGKTAQALYGGPRNSSSKVQRTRDAAVREWRALTRRLDAVRDEFVYRSVQPSGSA
ncbi:hypothetical protein [Streptomyces sp. NPDC050704]|uniref:hypothetical protein n=1 Tax=Streptomyces sp. NPDC050704 TaxID=3157219 RepID=UPI0034238011